MPPINFTNPISSRATSGLQGYLSKGGISTDTLDKMLVTQTLEQLLVQNPEIGKYIEAYLRMAQSSLQMLCSREQEPMHKALFASVDLPSLDYFKNLYVESPLEGETLPKDILDNPENFKSQYGLNAKEVEAIKMLFSPEWMIGPDGEFGSSQPSFFSSKTMQEAQQMMQSQGSGQQGQDDGKSWGGNSGQQQQQEQEEYFAVSGSGQGSGKAGFSKNMMSKEIDGPPGWPPNGAPGQSPTSGTSYTQNERQWAQEHLDESDQGIFNMLFDREDQTRGIYANVYSQLEALSAVKQQIMLELGTIDPNTPEGKKKLTELQYKLGDLQTNERELFDMLHAAQQARKELVEFVTKMLETDGRVAESIIRNMRSG